MPEYSIEVKGLTRKFGPFTAVDNVSFRVKKGDIFGFLGANGAGKSTTIRMLCALLTPTSGTARVGGFDINAQPEKVKEHIGYMSQKFSLYDDLTVEENIVFFGGIYGLSGASLRARMSWVLEMAGLKGREKSLARELSAGWKQRLALGCAVLHEPEIVFLDEPTGGVDPVSRRRFWELINRLSEQGVSIFVTTHYLDEAEYCNDIRFIHAGKLVAEGSPQELKEKYLTHPILEVECENAVDAMEILQGEDWVLETSIFGTSLHVGVEDEESGRARINALLAGRKIPMKRIDRIMPSLEDVFIHQIERQSRGPEA
ncbi:MAG: ABC transporter ATP-binding protein [Candidatus Aminicenantales bacterium]